MSWKQKIEDRIKRDIFQEKFKTLSDVELYLEKELPKFLEVDENEYVSTIRSSDKLVYNVYDVKVDVIYMGASILIYSYGEDEIHPRELVSIISFENEKLVYDLKDSRGTNKPKNAFDENALYIILKEALKPLYSSEASIIEKPSFL